MKHIDGMFRTLRLATTVAMSGKDNAEGLLSKYEDMWPRPTRRQRVLLDLYRTDIKECEDLLDAVEDARQWLIKLEDSDEMA